MFWKKRIAPVAARMMTWEVTTAFDGTFTETELHKRFDEDFRDVFVTESRVFFWPLVSFNASDGRKRRYLVVVADEPLENCRKKFDCCLPKQIALYGIADKILRGKWDGVDVAENGNLLFVALWKHRLYILVFMEGRLCHWSEEYGYGESLDGKGLVTRGAPFAGADRINSGIGGDIVNKDRHLFGRGGLVLLHNVAVKRRSAACGLVIEDGTDFPVVVPQFDLGVGPSNVGRQVNAQSIVIDGNAVAETGIDKVIGLVTCVLTAYDNGVVFADGTAGHDVIDVVGAGGGPIEAAVAQRRLQVDLAGSVAQNTVQIGLDLHRVEVHILGIGVAAVESAAVQVTRITDREFVDDEGLTGVLVVHDDLVASDIDLIIGIIAVALRVQGVKPNAVVKLHLGVCDRHVIIEHANARCVVVHLGSVKERSALVVLDTAVATVVLGGIFVQGAAFTAVEAVASFHNVHVTSDVRGIVRLAPCRYFELCAACGDLGHDHRVCEPRSGNEHYLGSGGQLVVLSFEQVVNDLTTCIS